MPKTSQLCPACRRIYDDNNLFCPRDGSRLDGGQRIVGGKFVLGKELGSGSMGAVFEAEQPAMHRKVALKLLHPALTRDPMMVERFEREAQAAGRVRHPNVVTVYDCGADEGQVYLAMEFLNGESLARRLAIRGRLPPKEALHLWRSVVAAMAEAHREGVVHRDLKPENLFIDRQRDGNELIKVLDFGIARLLEGQQGRYGTMEGTVIGTLLYMSPEQLEGKPAGPAADVYALGLILCELLTGRLPWGPRAGDGPGLHLLRLMQPPLPLHELGSGPFPPALQEILDLCLPQEPEQRPRDAAALEARVRGVLDAAPPAETQARRWPLPVAGAAMLLLGGALVMRHPGHPTALQPSGMDLSLPVGAPVLVATPSDREPPPTSPMPSSERTEPRPSTRSGRTDLRPSPGSARTEPRPPSDSAHTDRNRPPITAPAPRRAALEFQIITPTDRAVTISCTGGERCTRTGGICRLTLRTDNQCLCTARAFTYAARDYPCTAQRPIQVQLAPERF